MIVYGLTETQIREAVSTASDHYLEGNLDFRSQPYKHGSGYRFSLSPKLYGAPGSRKNEKGYRRPIACIHAYGWTVKEILTLNPRARVVIQGLGEFDQSNYQKLLSPQVDDGRDGECFCVLEPRAG